MGVHAGGRVLGHRQHRAAELDFSAAGRSAYGLMNVRAAWTRIRHCRLDVRETALLYPANTYSALGAYFRRLCSRMDKPKAVTAAAHKLARVIYAMLTKGEAYTDQGQDYYEERYRERVLRALSQRAAKLGMKMVPIEQPA